MDEDNNQLTEIVDFFKEIVAEETSVQKEEINVDDSFQELGLDSINAVFLLEKLEKRHGINLSPLLFWDYPTIHTFSRHIKTLVKDV